MTRTVGPVASVTGTGHQARTVRSPNTAEEGLSLLTAGIGAIQATTLTDAELSRVNEQLTRLALVVSLKFGERE